VFADVLLVDEINRAGPKTQSALLEAMEERQVSVDRKHYKLPPGFFVVATQNPREFEGTYPLPESQVDRFMLRVDLAYPTREHEVAVLQRYADVDAHAALPAIAAIDTQALTAAQAAVAQVHVAPELLGYVLEIAQASRTHPHVSLGLSTRGALALLRAARIHAGLNAAAFVSPDDVKSVAPWATLHRLLLSPEATLEGVSEATVLGRILEQVKVPR
jgi:MoxR-like ATPase